MARLPKTHDKWGCLEVINRGVLDGLGDGFHSLHYAELRCECSKVFRVSGLDWLGKNIQRDCGCGIYARTGRKVVFSVNIRQNHRQAITQIAADLKVTESEAMRVIIEAGLIHLDYEGEL